MIVSQSTESREETQAPDASDSGTGAEVFLFLQEYKVYSTTERSRLRFGSSKALIHGYLILCNKSAICIFVFEVAPFGKP